LLLLSAGGVVQKAYQAGRGLPHRILPPPMISAQTILTAGGGRADDTVFTKNTPPVQVRGERDRL